MIFNRPYTKIAAEILNPQRLILKPSLSRARNKFVKACIANFTEFEQDRNDILMHYVPRDENGNPIWEKDEEGNDIQTLQLEKLSEQKLSEFQDEMNKLFSESFVFEDEHVINALKLIFVDLDITFQNQDEVFFYDKFCELLEIDIEDNVKAIAKKILEG